MENVIIGQTAIIYTGIAETKIDTTDEQYGYYQVPLDIRNAHYPAPFPSLANDHVKFALIDDEVPLALGDKIDYKDYIILTNKKGEIRFAIVNPITRAVLESNLPKYSGLRLKENGTVNPPPEPQEYNRSSILVSYQLPRILVQDEIMNKAIHEINLKTASNFTSEITIPFLIPIIRNKSGVFTYPILKINAGNPVAFNVVAYHNALRNGINYVAFYNI
jgi:hypothetical protein